MHQMMDGSMMNAMGLVGILASVAIALSFVTLVKYLFLSKK
jgi:hypothetical protein